MRLKAHPRYDVFRLWFDKHHVDATKVAGVHYRVAGPRHTSVAELLAGIGAKNGGGRWNPPDVMKAVYLSGEPETAMFEANEHRRYYHLPPSEGMPKVTVAVRIEADAILDLTDAIVAVALPEPMTILLAEDWRAVMGRGDEATTQALGRAAFDAGFKGLILPSKPDPSGKNLLVFPERLSKSCVLEVLNSDELERLGKPG